MTTKDEFEALAETQAELLDACRKLAAHAAVVAVAVRTPEAVLRADLDDAVRGIEDVSARLAEL
jgi:hypothetical protein